MRLKDIGTIVTGNTPSKKNNEYYESNDILFIKPSDIEENYITSLDNSEEYISEKARKTARILPEGAVLVTCIGTIGKVGILKKEASCNQQINAIIPNDKVIPKYLAYLIQSKQKILQSKANAPVVPIINKTTFSEIEINICDKDNQEKIVKQLELLKTIIDKRKEQIEELQNIIKSQFVEMFGDPILNNKKLECTQMPSVCEIIDGDRGKNYPKGEEFFEDEYCLFLNAKNVTSTGFSFDNCMFITKEKDKVLRNGKLQRGDIVLTTRGTIGNLAFYTKDIPYENVRINSGMVILRMKKNIVNEIFFIEQFKMQLENIKNKIANGSAQPQLPITKMNGINVLTPPIELQNQFAEIVKQIDKQKFEIQRNLEETQKLQKSLMNKYFG
mgnify:CR=1 FL=1